MTSLQARRAALAAAAAGVLLLLVTLGFVLVDGGVTQRTALLLFGGLALVAVYVVVDPAIVTALVSRPRSRRDPLGVLAAAAIIGLLVAANVVASRSTQATDLTRSGLYTLSPRSVTVVRQLDAELTVTGFFRSDQQQARHDVETLLDLYRQQSPRVRVRFVDPDQNGGLALSLGVKAAGSVVLQYRGKPPAVLVPAQQSESDLTAAIVRLESTRSPIVCWATGDGERDLGDVNEVSGYSAVADLLRTSSYRTQDVPLAQARVPAACDVLVVLQLSRPLSDAGAAAIRDYLARGGKLLLALDPWLDQRIVASANAVLQPYGASFDGGLVVEPDSAHSATDDATIPVIYTYGASPITRDLDGRYVFLPQATPITGAGAPGVATSDLAATTDHAYAIPQQRTDLARRSTDRPGPFVLLRSIEQRRAEGGDTRIIVSGTSALAENRTMPPSASGSNPDLLLASLDWLSEQDSLIAIAPKPAAAGQLALTNAGLGWNVVLAAVLLPLLLAGAGALVVLRRRRPV